MVRLSEKLNISTDYSPRPANGWYNVGAGGGGALFHPKISPHDKNLWMICCDMSNTYISYDAGKHWRMLHLNTMVRDIVFDPVNPDVIYAGSQAIYRTKDRGQTWHLVLPTPKDDQGNPIPVTHDTVIGMIFKLHIDRKNPEHIYVGFHTRRYPRSMPGGGLKLYASYDGAESWQDLGDMEGSEIFAIDVAETGNGRAPYVFTNAGCYKYDGGALVKQPLPDKFVLPLTMAEAGVHPDTGLSVFFIITNLEVDAGGAVSSGVYRSFDAGKTWAELGGFDVDFPDKAGGKRLVKDISVSYYNPSRVYASLARRPLVLPSCNVPGAPYEAEYRHPYLAPGGQAESLGPVNRMGVLVSDDYGDTWRWTLEMDLHMPDNATVGWYENAYDVDWLGQPWYMDVDERNPDMALAALQGFAWITHDGGATWQQVYTEQYEDGSWYGKSFESTTCYDVVFDPFDKDTVLITYTDNGMLKSTNGGKTWKHAIEGVPYDWINTCYKMVFDPEVPGLAWGVWTSVHDLPDHFMRRIHIAKIPPHAKGGVCITEDSASTWRNLTDSYERGFIHTCIALDPASPVGSRTLYMSRCPDGVLKSTDGGKTWENKTVGFGINKNVFYLSLSADGKLYAVTMKTLTDEDTPDDIRQAMWQGGLYVSEDGAETWSEMNLPKNVGNPQKIAFDPTNPDCIYLTAFPVNTREGIRGGYYAQDKADLIGGGVYKSLDGGKTWQNIFDERVIATGITVDPDNPAAVYFVTIEFAAYRSLDFGKTWERIRGYHFMHGKNPILDPYNKDMMYITTFGGSVFYGPRAGGTERYDDIDGFTLDHRV